MLDSTRCCLLLWQDSRLYDCQLMQFEWTKGSTALLVQRLTIVSNWFAAVGVCRLTLRADNLPPPTAHLMAATHLNIPQQSTQSDT